MRYAITFVLAAGISNATVFAQKRIDLGPNFSKNSSIIRDAVQSMPTASKLILQSQEVRAELDLSESQLRELNTRISSLPSIADLRRKRKGGGELRRIGTLSEKEMKSITADVKLDAEEVKVEFLKSVQGTLKDDQWERLRQLIVQHELIEKRNAELRRVPEAIVDLTDEERKELKVGMRKADKEIMEVEIKKLRYVFYRKVLVEVLGEKRAEEAFGDPLGFEVDADKGKNQGNVRRRQ